MGKVKAEGSSSKRRGKALSGTRVVIFSTAAALGVIAVRRNRAARDAVPTPAPAVAPVAAPAPAAVAPPSTVPALKKAEPAFTEDPQLTAISDAADEDDEPPIWAAPEDPIASPATAFEAAFTGAPTGYGQGFAPPTATTDGPGLSALTGEPWAAAPLGSGQPSTSPAGTQSSGKGVLLATPARRKIAIIVGIAVLVIITIVALVV